MGKYTSFEGVPIINFLLKKQFLFGGTVLEGQAGQSAVAVEGRQTPRCSVSVAAQVSISALDGMSLTADVPDEHPQ